MRAYKITSILIKEGHIPVKQTLEYIIAPNVDQAKADFEDFLNEFEQCQVLSIESHPIKGE